MELLRVLLYAVQEYTFLKFAEICVAILDENVIFYFIFKIFRKKNRESPKTYLNCHFSWYLCLGLTIAKVVETSVTVNKNSPIQDYVHPDDETQPTFEYFHNKVSFYEVIVQSFLILENNFTLFLMQQKLRALF